jgi:hypothetical protein
MMQSLQPKGKKGTKKKKGKISPPALASEEQPTQSPGKEELAEQDPDFTIQPGDEVVELVSNGTQDEGTRSYPLTLCLLMLWRISMMKTSLYSKFL